MVLINYLLFARRSQKKIQQLTNCLTKLGFLSVNTTTTRFVQNFCFLILILVNFCHVFFFSLSLGNWVLLHNNSFFYSIEILFLLLAPFNTLFNDRLCEIVAFVLEEFSFLILKTCSLNFLFSAHNSFFSPEYFYSAHKTRNVSRRK